MTDETQTGRPDTGPGFTVVLIDDHPVIGLAVQHALTEVPALSYVGAAATVDEALALPGRIDAALLDVSLQDGSSPVQNLARLTEAGMAVVVYTSGENAFLLRDIARNGSAAIVRKSEPMDALVDTLLALSRGDSTLSVDVAAVVDADPRLAEARLSDKEREILALFATGHKAQSVAFSAGISVGTVADYVRRIRAKYAAVGRPATSAVGLYQRAVEDGAVPHPLSGGTEIQ